MNRIVSILLLAVLVGGLYGAGRMDDSLLQMRRAYGISQTEPLVNAPPLVAFTTVALGGFRGILADILWLRLSRLQDEGRYFELVQLADWITKLEPRFTSVWAFHAWNLAYNISVLFQDPGDRWRWVSHGIHLLRDEGLRYNPGDARLLYELGWLFQHKVGGRLDSAHLYYKRAWAEEMMAIFDGPQPDYGALALAASTRDDLMKRPGVAALVARIEREGRDPFSFQRVAEARQAGADDPLNSPAGRDLIDFLRLRRLRDTYHLDPALMREVDRMYGPLDWRLPQAHAIYWAWRSRTIATGFDKIAADRMIFQSLGDAFHEGRLFYVPERGLFIPSPNLDVIPRVEDAFLNGMSDSPDQESIRTAHANFLREAILLLVTYNRIDEARRLFDELRERYPSDENAVGFTRFIYRTYAASAESLTDRNAQALVEGALYQALYWQALGSADRAAGYDQLARISWEAYMAPREKDADLKERTGLPPLDELRGIARQRLSEALGGLK